MHTLVLLYAHASLALCRLQSCCLQTLVLLHAEDRGLLLYYFCTCSALSIPLLPTWGSTALLLSCFTLRALVRKLMQHRKWVSSKQIFYNMIYSE